MSTDKAVIVDDVSKTFVVHHNRVKSLKGRFVGLMQRRWRQQSEEFHALSSVTFDIDKGAAIGIMGPNGSGKSTLLQIIAGVYPPTGGRVQVNGHVAPLISLGVGFHPELTGEENIYLGASLFGWSNKRTRERYQQIVEFSELGSFIDTPVKNYSSGMHVRLGFSMAIHLDPDILLADEILAVGDVGFKQKCLEKVRELRRNGMTLIFVSHIQNLVDSFCDSYIRLEKGRVVDQGSVSAAIPQ
jgi:ABC-2 type transport system ATP-binding protein/lipopolysaccharide transport system ATP-binding protein